MISPARTRTATATIAAGSEDHRAPRMIFERPSARARRRRGRRPGRRLRPRRSGRAAGPRSGGSRCRRSCRWFRSRRSCRTLVSEEVLEWWRRARSARAAARAQPPRPHGIEERRLAPPAEAISTSIVARSPSRQAAGRQSLGELGGRLLGFDDELDGFCGGLGEARQRRGAQQPPGIDRDEPAGHALNLPEEMARDDDGDPRSRVRCARSGRASRRGRQGRARSSARRGRGRADRGRAPGRA